MNKEIYDISNPLVKAFLKVNRFVNYCTGGDKYGTVSARSGYHQVRHNDGRNHSMYWFVLACIIDIAFRYVDGKDHCLRAYRTERLHNIDFANTSGLGRIVLSLIAIAFCFVLAVFSYLYVFFIRPVYRSIKFVVAGSR